MSDIAAADLRTMIREKVAAAGSSFYLAMRLLPEPRREAMYSIYAFCREVDDIADSDEPEAAKRKALEDWRAEIDAIYAGTSKLPLGQVLTEDMKAFHLRRDDFIAVIDGMEMDAGAPIHAPSIAVLDLYCDRVASAVGRLSVRAFGADSDAADRVAYHLGRALQLTNILRDVAEDAGRGRLYLPRDLLVEAGITTDALDEILAHPNLPQVCEKLSVVAEQHFVDAHAAMAECPPKAMKPARAMGAVYHAQLNRLQQRGWQKFAEPIKLSKLTKLWLAFRYGLL